jgi:hypothetical protein
MNKINKILIISVLACCFMLNLVLADNTDCWLLVNETYKHKNWEDDWFEKVNQVWETDSPDAKFSNFLTVDQQKLILTKADLNTAMLNLKKYCCENNKWWLSMNLKTCDDDLASFNPNAMDSEYLFDHIFDVMMRRLAWLTGDKNIYENSKMTEVDDKWKERRDFITDKAEDLSWSDVQSIIDEYQKYWVKSKPNLWYDITEEVNRTFGPNNDQDFLRFIVWDNWMSWDKNGKVAEAMKNYDKWTLYDRYSNVCAMSKYFYALLNYSNSDNSDRWRFVDRLANWTCERVVQSQIENENQYVQTVVQNSANLLMENYIEWYLQYLYDRSNKLKDIWRSAEDRWMDVIRAVPYLLKACVR